MSGFLLDTNAVSELVKPRPNAGVVRWVDATDEQLVFLSVMTLGEIRKGIAVLGKTSRAAALEAWLVVSLPDRFAGRILPVDEPIADRWGKAAAAARAPGRPLETVDGLLAATALQHNLTLVTRNGADVAVTGVSILNPWS